MELPNVMSALIIIKYVPHTLQILGDTTPNKWLHPDNRYLFLVTFLKQKNNVFIE